MIVDEHFWIFRKKIIYRIVNEKHKGGINIYFT